jgi:CHAT domain-containing protein
VLTREHANAAELTEALAGPRLRALHLACHGHVDDQRPRLSGLVLADGEMLTLDDVARLDIDADLVVLSACESGRGRLVTGEGILGLVRACMAAGAPRVVVANWGVGDQIGRTVMLDFYRCLLRENASPAAALRAAQRQCLHQGGATAHPSHWATFVVWGG